MSVLERIKMLCMKNSTSISKLEKQLGFSNGSLAKAKTIKNERLSKIADYFGVTVDYLLNGEQKTEWKPSLSDKEINDIGTEVQNTLNALDSETGLMFDGEILDEETKEYL